MASKKKSNFERKRRKKPVLTASAKNDKELTVQDVLELGGDEADFELLKGVADDDDFATGGEIDTKEDEVKKFELQNLIKELGLQSFKNQAGLKKSVCNDEMVNTGAEKNGAKAKESTKSKKSKKKEINVFKEATQAQSNAKSNAFDVETKDRLLIHPTGRWFEDPSLSALGKKEQVLDLECSIVEKLKKTAETLLENESAIYRRERERKKPSDVEWLKTVANSGTLGDKIAALALQIQESPLHHLKTLDILLNMASKKGRRECLMAIGN